MIWSGLIVLTYARVISLGLGTPIDQRAQHFIPSNDGTFQYTIRTAGGDYISPQEANTPVIKSSGVDPRFLIPSISSSPEGSEGDYFYVTVDGVKKKVKYVAGTGFVAKVDSNQESPVILARSALTGKIPVQTEGEYFYVNDGGIKKKVKYVAGTGFVGESPETRTSSRAIASSPVINSATQLSEGDYFYVTDGGIKKKVKYVSGAGFAFKSDFSGAAQTFTKSAPKYKIPVIKSSRGGTEDYFSVFVDGIKKDVKYVPGTGFVYKIDSFGGSPVTLETYARSNLDVDIPSIKSFGEGTEGDYFYVIVDGIKKKLKYVSGSGFVYKGEAAGTSPDPKYDIPYIRSSVDGIEDYFYVAVDEMKKKVKYVPGAGFVYKADFTQTPSSLLKSDPKYSNIPFIKSSGEGTEADYFYVFVDGVKKQVKYTPGTGFVYKTDVTGASPEPPKTPFTVTKSDGQYEIPYVRSSVDGIEDYFYVVVDGIKKNVKYVPGAGFVYKADLTDTPASLLKSDPKYSNIPFIKSSREGTAADYFYVFVDGVKKQVKYTPGTGFVYKTDVTGASEPPKTPFTVTKSDGQYEIPYISSSVDGIEDYFYVVVDGIKKNVKYVPGAGFVYKADLTGTPASLLKSDPKYSNIPFIRSSGKGEKADYFYVIVDGVKKQVKYTPETGFVYKVDITGESPETRKTQALTKSGTEYDIPYVRSSVGGTEDYFYVIVDGIKKKVKYTPGAGFGYTTDFTETPSILLKSNTNIPVIRSSGVGTEDDYFYVYVDGVKKQVKYTPGTGFVYKVGVTGESPGARKSQVALTKSGTQYDIPYVRSSVGGTEDYFYVIVDGIKKKVKYTPGAGFGYTTDFTETPSILLKSSTNIPVIRSSGVGTEDDYFYVYVDGVKKQVKYTPGTGFVYKVGVTGESPVARKSQVALTKSGKQYDIPYVRSSIGGTEDYFYVIVDGIMKKVKYAPGAGFVYKADVDQTPAILLKSNPKYSNIPVIRSSGVGTEEDYFYVFVDGVKKQVKYSPGSGFVYKTKTSPETSAAFPRSIATYETPSIRSSGAGIEDYFYVVVDGIKKKVKYTKGTGFVYNVDFAETPEVLIKSAGKQSSIPNIRSSVDGAEADYFNVFVDGIKKKVRYTPGAGFVYTKYDESAEPLVKSGNKYTEADKTVKPARSIGDATYSFNYKTADSSRREESDAQHRVTGSYTYVGDDGITREVRYIAGKGIGFVATGDHLPSAPKAPVPVKQEIPVVKSSPEGRQADYFYATIDGVQKKVKYIAGTGFVTTEDSTIPVLKSAKTNADYIEISDGGIKKKVKYIANTGFVSKSEDVTKDPEGKQYTSKFLTPSNFESGASKSSPVFFTA